MSISTSFEWIIGVFVGISGISLYYNLYYGAPSYVFVINGAMLGALMMFSIGIFISEKYIKE